MTFHLTPDRLADLTQIETESNCTIAAGVDLYRHSQPSPLAELTALVTAHWGNVLDPETIQTIATDVEGYLNTQVSQRLQAEQAQSTDRT